jgi:hypothetical protein
MLPDRVCSKCTPGQQKEWGCDAYQDDKGAWHKRSLVPMEVDGKESWVCPRRPVKDDPSFFGELMTLYGLYKEGVLADEGSIMSQSQKYVTLMRLVHSTVNECQAEMREKT